MSHDTNGPNEVGYKKPPKHTQFRKGQSGNPRGRQKGEKNIATIAREILTEYVTITESSGKKRKITRWEATLRILSNKALGGDTKAFRLLVDLVSKELIKIQPPINIWQLPGDDNL